MEKSNQKEKNESKEAESIKKGLRAESLFRYIEKKDLEFKQQRHSLLKSIVAKQRQKIAYESERWEKKLKGRELKCPKVFGRKKLETVAPDHNNESRSNDTIASKIHDELTLTYSLKSSLRGSRNISGQSSLIGSRTYLFDQTLRSVKPELMAIRPIPILAELQEQKELHVTSSSKAVVEKTAAPSSKAKKIHTKKVQKAIEESEAIAKVFKTYDAFLDFQAKYSKPVEESEHSEGDDGKQPIESRMVQIRRLHNVALKNRERIALYMSGDSNYAMGVPIGFKVDPHSITDKTVPSSERFEELEEKVNLTEELIRPSLVGKRASISIGKGQTGSAPENETEDNLLNKKAFSLAQSQFEKGRRPTIYQNKDLLLHDEDSSINDILEYLAKNVDKDEKSRYSPQNSYKTAQGFSEEDDLLKSLAVMADDRLGLSSNFLQKSLARSDSLIKRSSDLHASKSLLRLKSVNIPEKEKAYAPFLEEDPEILQFSSHSGTSKTSSIQNLAVKVTPKYWEHINLKSVEDFGSTIETSKAKLDHALKRIPNSFNQLCLNIEKDNSRPKLGVFAASISSKTNTETIQSEKSKLKIPKAVKYWKTSSSFDDDIPTFS